MDGTLHITKYKSVIDTAKCRGRQEKGWSQIKPTSNHGNKKDISSIKITHTQHEKSSPQ